MGVESLVEWEQVCNEITPLSEDKVMCLEVVGVKCTANHVDCANQILFHCGVLYVGV